VSDHHHLVERAARRLPRTTRGVVLAAALAFGATGGLLGAAIVGLGVGPELLQTGGFTPGGLGIAAAVAGGAALGAAVSGAPLWWLAVERPGEVSLLRGGLVGVGVGLLAHPLMWVFAGTGVGATVLVVEGPAVLAAVGPEAVWGALLGFLLFTFFGMLFTGIVTVPVAVVTGVALAHVRSVADDLDRQRRRHV
jgi:hypothetical protein